MVGIAEEQEQLKAQLEETKTKLQDAERERDKHKSELHDIREELERTQSQLDEVLGELEQTHFELHQLKEKPEVQKPEINASVKEELEQSKSQLQTSQAELGQTKSQLQETKEELERTYSQLDQIMGELEESNFELHQLKEKGQSESSGALKEELDKTKSELHDVREELERSLSQFDEVLGELEQTHFELHQLKEKGAEKQSQSEKETNSHLSEEDLAETKSQIDRMVVGLNQLLEKLGNKELNKSFTQLSPSLIQKQPLNPRSQPRKKIENIEETVIVAGVTMFKDEEDVAYHNLVWHYNMGIKRFVIMDNLSSDNTASEVRRFANDYLDAQVYLIEDPEVGYYQSRKMTAAAEFAYKMWGAEWILPFDADEILCSFRSPVHTVIESLGKEHIALSLPYKVHVMRSFDDSSETNPFKRMAYRTQSDVHQGAKVIIRWQSGMIIGQGNHNVTIDGKSVPITKGTDLGLALRHYPFRSKEHIRQKVINGGKAYEAAADLRKKYGRSWKAWNEGYKKLGEKYIDQMYEYQVKQYPDAIYDPAVL